MNHPDRPWGPPGLLSVGLRSILCYRSPPSHAQGKNEWGCTTTPHTPITLSLTTTWPTHRFALPVPPSVCAHSCPRVVYPRRPLAVAQWWRRRLRPARRSPALYTHASSARRCASRPQRRRVRCVWFEDCKQTEGAWCCIQPGRWVGPDVSKETLKRRETPARRPEETWELWSSERTTYQQDGWNLPICCTE